MNRVLKFKKQLNITAVLKGLILLLILGGIFFLCINPDHQQKIISHSNDIITSNAEDIWNSRWGGASTDQGNGVAVDSNQSIYIIGTDYSHDPFGSCGLIKYFPNGTVAWNITWGNGQLQGGKGIVIFNDFIYCVGTTANEIGLIKVSPIGSVIWNTSHGRPSWTCYGNGVVADANESLYCTGYGFIAGSNSWDLFLVKFSSNGTLLWNISIPHAAGYNVAVDSCGFVYCMGTLWKMVTENLASSSILLAKFSPEGNLIYNVSWGTTGNGEDLVIDPNDNIYCIGYSSDRCSSADITLLKFSSNGILIWKQTWGGFQEDIGSGIALDSENAIYCVGYTSSYKTREGNFVIIKYLPNGNLVGYVIWGSGKSEFCADIAIDNIDGSMYCGGSIVIDNNPWNEDYLLVKFSLSIELINKIYFLEVPGINQIYFSFALLMIIVYNLKKNKKEL